MASAPPQENANAAPAQPNAAVRVWRAWRALATSQKMSAVAAFLLLVTMFLPWFSQHAINQKTPVSLTLTAFDAFSLVEAIVLLISLGVLALMFVRGESRGRGSPASDGAVILLAGGLGAVLVVYRMFSTPSGGPGVTTGLQWGIFLALIVSIWLASTGRAMRRPASGRDPAPSNLASAPRQRGDATGGPLTREDARGVTFEHPRDGREE